MNSGEIESRWKELSDMLRDCEVKEKQLSNELASVQTEKVRISKLLRDYKKEAIKQLNRECDQ